MAPNGDNQTRLSKLTGKPMVKVMALDAPDAGQAKRVGFLQGQVTVPEDFDRMGSDQVEQLFGSGTYRAADPARIPA
jgi:hypothetical protein